MAPYIPGLNDYQKYEILRLAREAVAQWAFYSLLRLSGSVEPVFLERMAAMFPDRIRRITHRLEAVRGGLLNDSRFFDRQKGQGSYADMLQQLFQTAKKKAGFEDVPDDPVPA